MEIVAMFSLVRPVPTHRVSARRCTRWSLAGFGSVADAHRSGMLDAHPSKMSPHRRSRRWSAEIIPCLPRAPFLRTSRESAVGLSDDALWPYSCCFTLITRFRSSALVSIWLAILSMAYMTVV